MFKNVLKGIICLGLALCVTATTLYMPPVETVTIEEGVELEPFFIGDKEKTPN